MHTNLDQDRIVSFVVYIHALALQDLPQIEFLRQARHYSDISSECVSQTLTKLDKKLDKYKHSKNQSIK